MYLILIAKPFDSLIFLPFELSFSEPKIGSERDARNVSDFHWKTYRFIDFPIVRVSGSFSAPKKISERDARNLSDFHWKTYRFVDFPPGWASGRFSKPKIGSERDDRNV